MVCSVPDLSVDVLGAGRIPSTPGRQSLYTFAFNEEFSVLAGREVFIIRVGAAYFPETQGFQGCTAKVVPLLPQYRHNTALM